MPIVTQNDTIQDIANRVAETLYDPANVQLPGPELITFYAMKAERKYWLDFQVDMSAVELIKQIIVWNSEDKGIAKEVRKPIWIYLFNYGGDADCGWSLINAILTSDTPIYTVNIGVCASAAALIFMAGEKRFLMPGSSVMIHEGAAQFNGDSTKVLDASDSYKAMLKRMHEYILSRTEIPASTLNKKKNNDWELSAADCIKYRVADKVVESMSEII